MTTDSDNTDNIKSQAATQASWIATIVTALLAIGCLAVLGAAMATRPDGSGVGTHEQLGLRPCGFLDRTDYPCISCGMTTSFSLAVRGRLLASFINQPAGAFLAIGTMALAIYFTFVTLTRKKIDLLYIGIYWKRYFFSGLALLLGVWAVQGFRRWLELKG